MRVLTVVCINQQTKFELKGDRLFKFCPNVIFGDGEARHF